MKKLLLISLISIAFLSSCGNSDNNKKDKKGQNAKTESARNKSFITVLEYDTFIKNVWDLESNANEFVFKGERPCVIDFHATWCGPCKTIAPIMEKLAKAYNGKVDFYKVDIDQNQKLAAILQIRNIPTIYYLRANAIPEKSIGAQNEEFYRSIINEMLSE